MVTYFVSRHPGAIEWAERHGHEAKLIAHLEPSMVQAGDVVLGTLPIQLVAVINERGARYFHLEMTIPEAQRGASLTASDMERFGAKLTEFEARRVATAAPNAREARKKNDRDP